MHTQATASAERRGWLPRDIGAGVFLLALAAVEKCRIYHRTGTVREERQVAVPDGADRIEPNGFAMPTSGPIS
jgi:hypothetical protein